MADLGGAVEGQREGVDDLATGARRWWPLDVAAARTGVPVDQIRRWSEEGRVLGREVPGIFEPELVVDAASLEAQVARVAAPAPDEQVEAAAPAAPSAQAQVIPLDAHNRVVELLRETTRRAGEALRDLAEERSRRIVLEAEVTRLREELLAEREERSRRAGW